MSYLGIVLVITSKQLIFSKWFIYWILMIILVTITLGSKIANALNYKRTMGQVRSFTFTEYEGSRGRMVNYYPVVDYVAENQTFTCYGSSFQHDEVFPHDSLPVIYNPQDPAKGFVYNFLGYWVPPLAFLLPLSLTLTLMFGIDQIPKLFTIKF